MQHGKMVESTTTSGSIPYSIQISFLGGINSIDWEKTCPKQPQNAIAALGIETSRDNCALQRASQTSRPSIEDYTEITEFFRHTTHAMKVKALHASPLHAFEILRHKVRQQYSERIIQLKYYESATMFQTFGIQTDSVENANGSTRADLFTFRLNLLGYFTVRQGKK
jgi:hypothetical protein